MAALVIFGATSAISQAYLQQVADRYSSIALVARNDNHLNQVADHIRTLCEAEVLTYVSDLADISCHETLVEGIGVDLDTVLICYGELSDQARCTTDTEYAEQQLRLNGSSTISLARTVSALMVRNRRGVIGVVGSVAGDRGRSSNYYYGTAKAAVETFLSGLRADVRSAGVRIITVKPGFVDTPMTREIKKGVLWVKPEKVAADIDRAMRGNADVIYTPWFWRYIMLVIKCVPEKIFKRLSL